MKHPALKIWFLATIFPVFVAIIIRIIWEIVVNPSTSGLVMSILVILGLVGLYGLILYFTLKPNRKILTSPGLWLGFAVMATLGLIAGIIHAIRFIPSPQVGLPWSLVIVCLYFLAGLSAYFMLLWFVWSLWKKKGDDGEGKV
jgi:hypothetical protein